MTALPYWHLWSDVLTLKMFWGGNHTDRIVANLIDRTQLRPILTAWPLWNLPGHLHSMMYSRRIFGTSMYYQHVYIYIYVVSLLNTKVQEHTLCSTAIPALRGLQIAFLLVQTKLMFGSDIELEICWWWPCNGIQMPQVASEEHLTCTVYLWKTKCHYEVLFHNKATYKIQRKWDAAKQSTT